MSERAVHALPFGERDCVFVDGVQHLIVAREKIILAEKKISVAPIPDHHSILQFKLQILRSQFPCKLTHAGKVFGIAGRHQRERIYRASPIGLQRFLLQNLARVVENEF